MAKRPVIDARIDAIIPETQRVATFRIALPPEAGFSFTAGQFVMASLPDFKNDKDRPVRRAYSISSSPVDLAQGYLELTITRVGEGGWFSNRIHECRPGDPILVEGPYGSAFTLEAEDPRPHLFVGAGSGIAPLRGMIRTLLPRPVIPPITLVYGFRKTGDFIFEKELRSYKDLVPDYVLHTAHSRPDPGWAGLSGRVPEILPALFSRYEGQVVYLCGHPEMVGGTVEFFRKAGFPDDAVRKEQW